MQGAPGVSGLARLISAFIGSGDPISQASPCPSARRLPAAGRLAGRAFPSRALASLAATGLPASAHAPALLDNAVAASADADLDLTSAAAAPPSPGMAMPVRTAVHGLRRVDCCDRHADAGGRGAGDRTGLGGESTRGDTRDSREHQ